MFCKELAAADAKLERAKQRFEEAEGDERRERAALDLQLAQRARNVAFERAPMHDEAQEAFEAGARISWQMNFIKGDATNCTATKGLKAHVVSLYSLSRVNAQNAAGEDEEVSIDRRIQLCFSSPLGLWSNRVEMK